MENNAFKDENLIENEQEVIAESFICCVCLDLLYKPIVLSCGHVSCFWCVHKSMNGWRESHCPICRLWFSLNQTREEEEKMGDFSPQFDAYTGGSQVVFDHPGSSPSSATINQASNSCSMEYFECTEQSGSVTHKGDEGTIYSEHTSNRTPEVIGLPFVEGKRLPQNQHNQQPKILVADLMCTMCKQLLFHPVVLNCGHVYCETCIINLSDEMLRCQLCQSPHPRGFSKVCLALDHFLGDQFPEEYAQRRDAIQLSQIKVKPETTSCSLHNDKGEKIAWWSDPGLAVHIGVGCDFCGIPFVLLVFPGVDVSDLSVQMYPIIGDRYRCVECKEKIGFDLCGDCYKTRSKLPGRFNQQHTPEHKFMLVQELSINTVFTADDPASADDGEDNQSESETTN